MARLTDNLPLHKFRCERLLAIFVVAALARSDRENLTQRGKRVAELAHF